MSRHERKIPDFVFDNLDNLKGAAQKQGYTFKTLGEAAGIAGSMVQNLSSGWASPSMGSYNKIAAVLGWKEWR